nr:hypothetical protein [Tanacetum cinerariifolium]
MDRTYTWVEARDVATNGVSNDRRDSFKRPKKSSWNNNKGKMGRIRSFAYKMESHILLSNLAKSPREIFAIERVAKTFERPPRPPRPNWTKDKTRYCHFLEDYEHETNKCQELKHHIEEAVKIGQPAHLVKGVTMKKEKTSDTYGSSSEVIYKHYFLKLKLSIGSLRVDSNTPLVDFSREESWSLGEIPAEVTIGEGWKEKRVPDSDGHLKTTTERVFETYKNVNQDIKDQLNAEAEAEAVQIILTGIDNDIYSTVDACLNAYEMWKAIERLKQGESINVQDLETNLYWE